LNPNGKKKILSLPAFSKRTKKERTRPIFRQKNVGGKKGGEKPFYSLFVPWGYARKKKWEKGGGGKDVKFGELNEEENGREKRRGEESPKFC